jgi:predicted transcriptional regulator
MGSGHVAYYRHGQNRRKAFSRLPSPVVDESESAGILKMLLLHRQAVLVRIGGKVGGIMTWADVLDARKVNAGDARRLD